jgi:hypothetical protein
MAEEYAKYWENYYIHLTGKVTLPIDAPISRNLAKPAARSASLG